MMLLTYSNYLLKKERVEVERPEVETLRFNVVSPFNIASFF